MKIAGCRTIPLPQHFSEPLCVLELLTDEAPTGIAIARAHLAQSAARLVDEILLNMDVRAVATAWQRMSRIDQARDGSLRAVIAALDIALWDLKAKREHQPLWRTLGALQPRANVHVRAPPDQRVPLVDFCSNVASNNIRGVVVSSSGDPEADAVRLAAIRDMLGRHASDLDLMLDAGARWSPKEAIRALRRIERTVDLNWVEAPAPATDFLGLKRVSAAVGAAVCSGGRLHALTDYLPHLHLHSIDFIQVDTSKTGLTEALRIADAAYAFELPIVLTTSPGDLHVHLAAALPTCASIEVATARGWSDESSPHILATDVRIEHGRAIAGTNPGHGVSIDLAALRTSSLCA